MTTWDGMICRPMSRGKQAAKVFAKRRKSFHNEARFPYPFRDIAQTSCYMTRIEFRTHIADKIGYISTGGGAFLEFMEGKVLPAVGILMQRAG